MGASLPVDGHCCHRRAGSRLDIVRDPNELVSTKWPTYVHVGRAPGTWSLRVMSYDVLCDTKCTKKHFAFAHEESLCPVRRQHLVARRIRHLSPDVLCLQEVMNPRALLDTLNCSGAVYESSVCSSSQLAVIWKADLFEQVDSIDVCLSMREDPGEVNAALLVLLQPACDADNTVDDEPFWVCNVHLQYFTNETPRNALEALFDRLEIVLADRPYPVIAPGVWSVLPDLNEYRWLRSQSKKDGLLRFASAYQYYDPFEGEPRFTCFNSVLRGTVDYIFFTESRFAPLRLLQTLTKKELRAEVALPNRTQPSDHLPLMVDFERFK